MPVFKLDKSGKPPVGASRTLRKLLNTFAGKMVQVEIKEYKPKRSLAQNRLFHKWVAEISDQIYHPKDAVKEWLKQRYIGETVHDICGRQVVVTKPTSKLGVVKFAEFLTQVEVWCVESGIDITHPIDYRLAMYGVSK